MLTEKTMSSSTVMYILKEKYSSFKVDLINAMGFLVCFF